MNPSIPPGSFKPRRRVADELTSMSRRRSPRSFVACVAVLIGIATVVVPNPRPAQAVGADDTIMGPSRVTATQMAAWFQAKTTSPYRAGVPLEQLVSLYLSEGNLAGVRGDIAFAQSILETRWFSFPAGGLLTPAQNNFAGIGACDSCVTGITFATVQLGVRAQMQQLRRYADPNSRSWNIGAPPVQPLWASNAAYDAMNRTHGWAPYWQNLSGTWATAPSYAAIINQLYNSLWDSSGRPGAGHWGGWELPGGLAANSTSSAAGAVASGPAVASWQPNRLDVFAASSGGFLLHKWWDGQVWSVGWENLSNPPTGPIVGNPATVSWGPGRIDVFVRGTDNQLWRQAFDGQRWTGWSPLGGTLTASPTVASQGPNRLDVFVTGTDLQVWSISWSGTAWSGWTALAGVVIGSPTAVAPAPGRLALFVRGNDSSLWYKAWDGSAWQDWTRLGGALTSSPAASAWATNRIDVFVRGTDGGLWRKTWDGAFWRVYDAVGGQATSDPAAVSWAPGRIDVFVRGTDARLWHQYGY